VTEPCRIDPTVWRSLKIINDMVVPLLADASGPNAQHLRIIANHVQQVRARLGNQDWAARKDDPPTPEQRSYFEDRDEEIGERLGEIGELTLRELLGDVFDRRNAPADDKPEQLSDSDSSAPRTGKDGETHPDMAPMGNKSEPGPINPLREAKQTLDAIQAEASELWLLGALVTLWTMFSHVSWKP
jgi:hypothetical protein